LASAPSLVGGSNDARLEYTDLRHLYRLFYRRCAALGGHGPVTGWKRECWVAGQGFDAMMKSEAI
jgi:hypothetical protein